MSTVHLRRYDGEELEVAEGAAPVYERRGWVRADSGTVKVSDVLEQVGDDPAKARAALAAEKASEKPRKSLVSALEERAASSTPTENKEK